MGRVNASTPLHAAQAAAAAQDHEHPQRLDSADDEQAHRDMRRDPRRRAPAHASWEPGTAPEAEPPADQAAHIDLDKLARHPERHTSMSDSAFASYTDARNALAQGHALAADSTHPVAERPGPDAQPASVSSETLTEKPPSPTGGGYFHGTTTTLVQPFQPHFAGGYRGGSATVEQVNLRDPANTGQAAQLGSGHAAAARASMPPADRPATSAEPSPAAPRPLGSLVASNVASTIPSSASLAGLYTRAAPGEQR
jgi:hypothetical protein